MNKILSFVLVAVVCCCVISCNEKPKGYKFVQVNKDGSEQVEKLEALNDTDALNKYFERMEKVLMENISKNESSVEAMYVISPEGDTLNKNAELLEAVMKNLPMIADSADKKAPEDAPVPAPKEQQ